jgi:localization factor PodJL
MKPGIPWSVKGIEPEVREAAKHAARRSGMTLGEWLNSAIMDRADDAPAVRMDRREPKERHIEPHHDVGETAIRLEDIAEQLSRIARREQETAPARAYVPTARAVESDTLSRILNRVESNERQTVEAFSAVNERLSVVGRQLAQVAKVTAPPRLEEAPGFQSLEKAVHNIVEHIEASDRRTKDTLKSLQDRMADMASRAAAPASGDDVLQQAPAFNRLESRLSDLHSRVERSETLASKTLPDLLQQELTQLAARIEGVRESSAELASRAQTAAVQASQQELRAIEQRILGLLREAQATFASQATSPADLQRLRAEVDSLNQRIDGARQGLASDRDVHALRIAVEQLSTRVAQGHDMRPLADMDRRLSDITQRLDQTQASTRNLPQFGELERRMAELDHRLNEAIRLQGDSQAQMALEQQLSDVSERLGRAEHQLSHLDTIERAINQLFDSMEQSRTHARQIAEESARRIADEMLAQQPSAPALAGSPELQALEEGLRAVRESANNADQRNQETLEAVHETLEQIVAKLAELETAAVGHQVAAAMAQPVAMAVPENELGDLQPGLPVEPEVPAFSPVLEPTLEEEVGNPFATVAEPAPELVPPPVHNPFERAIAESGAQDRESLTPADDLIAAARRAARAASEPKSILNGISPAAARLSEESSRKLWSKLPFMKPAAKATTGSDLETPRLPPEIRPASNDNGKRRKLLLLGLVLLAAVSAFTVNMMSRQRAVPAKAPAAIEGSVSPAQAPAAAGPAASAPVAAPLSGPDKSSAIEPSAVLPEVLPEDEILTGSLPSRPDTASLAALVSGDAVELPPAGIGPEALRKAAASGDAAAQFVVATRFLDGEKITQDLSAAALWYTRSAESGLAPAQYRLGTLYERGKGVQQNLATALSWYEKAAQQGNVRAMHNAAVIAAGNAAGQPDYAKAYQWFISAARHGLKDSQFNLAVLLERGLGVKADPAEAYFWYLQAANQDDGDAAVRAEALAPIIGQSAVNAAKLRVKSFKPETAPESANVVAVRDGAWQTGQENTAEAQPVVLPGGMVSQAQQLLTRLGFNVGEPDGKMGEKTANAIRLFQLQSGLEVTGAVSPQLIKELESHTS